MKISEFPELAATIGGVIDAGFTKIQGMIGPEMTIEDTFLIQGEIAKLSVLTEGLTKVLDRMTKTAQKPFQNLQN